ncbi:MAG: ParB/RepB/Spo0J family partition protein [Verrucomicrobiota bacterium]
MAAKRQALGRGIDALIKDGATAKKQATAKTAPAKKRAAPEGGIREVPVNKVVASPWQPRNNFGAEALAELVDSVKVHGVLQPLLVREVGSKFELIAGERRLRAAQAALLKKIPIIVIEASDEKALEIALIENLQREDLNPIEEAEGYALLQKKFNLTQEKVAEQVGKARASVANTLRLLELPDNIRKHVAEDLLSVGHAKVLLSIDSHKEMELLARRTIKEGLSVRALEKIIKKLGRLPKKPRAEKADLPGDYLHTLSDELHQYFGTSVRITPSKTLTNGRKVKGSIEVDFHNNDELDRLLTLIGYSNEL